MASTILTPVQRGRARFLEDATDAWKNERASSRKATDLEELIRICSGLPREWQRSWNDLLERISRREVEEPDEALEQLQSHFRGVLLRLRELAEIRDATEREGFGVDNGGELDRIVAELTGLNAQAFRHWYGPATAADAERAAAGECLDVDTAFAQAAGIDVDEWRHRVESRRQKRGQP